MEKAKMDRISELTALSRQRELTEEEKAERKALREEYLADWRRSTIDVLENTYIVDENGNKRKLKKK
ncbi:MAG: DUF896 domain-containing protein [Oscillospiraceae bacterium]